MTQEKNDRLWDLRAARRPTVWLVEPVSADQNPSGRPKVRSVQVPTPAAKDSSSEGSEVRLAA